MALAIVLAVYIPPHAPAPGQALRTMSRRYSSSMSPAFSAPAQHRLELVSSAMTGCVFCRTVLTCYSTRAGVTHCVAQCHGDTHCLGILLSALLHSTKGQVCFTVMNLRTMSWECLASTISAFSAPSQHTRGSLFTAMLHEQRPKDRRYAQCHDNT